MKLYNCLMLDESMPEEAPCIIAVMESEQEQSFYYANRYHQEARITLLGGSGYSNIDADDIEFWFPYSYEGIDYCEEIKQGMAQLTWDTWYSNFEPIDPFKEAA